MEVAKCNLLVPSGEVPPTSTLPEKSWCQLVATGIGGGGEGGGIGADTGLGMRVC